MDHWDLLEWLQVQSLNAMMHAWPANEGRLVFMGAAAMRFAYGSPRRTTNLDFLLGRAVNSERLVRQMVRDVAAAGTRAFGQAARIGRLAPSDVHAHLRCHTITLTHEALDDEHMALPLNFWLAEPQHLQANRYQPVLIQTHLKWAYPPFLLPAARLEVLCLNKILTLVDAFRPSARDCFDLWWLSQALQFTNGHLRKNRVDHLCQYLQSRDSPMPLSRLASRLHAMAELLQQEVDEAALLDELSRCFPGKAVVGFNTAFIRQIRHQGSDLCRALAQGMLDSPALS